MVIDNSIWFYTLSTISQTCAAILALGGTFIIFKLDKIQAAINNYRGRVVRILQEWRRGSKQPDKFYDETDKDILKQYRLIVAENDEDIFNVSQIIDLITSFENTRVNSIEKSGVYNLNNGVQLDLQERKRWCNRMADLLEKNLQIEQKIFWYLRISLILLTVSIFSCIVLLNNMPGKDNNMLFLVTTAWSIIAILFSGLSVWKIARSRPIY